MACAMPIDGTDRRKVNRAAQIARTGRDAKYLDLGAKDMAGATDPRPPA
jgi:hypothetical protein